MMATESFQALGPRPGQKGVAILAIVFGSATVMSGGNVLFGSDAAREMAGHVVPFVVWFNFFAGFAYIAAGLSIWRALPWALGLSVAIAVATCAVMVWFGGWVAAGGAYELRTAGALTFRTGLWVAIALALRRAGTRP